MAEQEHTYRILAEGGLVVTDDRGTEDHLAQGRVVPRDAFQRVDWLLKAGLIERVDTDAGEADA